MIESKNVMETAIKLGKSLGVSYQATSKKTALDFMGQNPK